MNRLLAILLLTLAGLAGYGVMRAVEDWNTSFSNMHVSPRDMPGEPGARVIIWDYFQYPYLFEVMQVTPGRNWWGSESMFGVGGPRSWPDSEESILVLLSDKGRHQLSLPFSLPTILTTLALLFLSAGVWLLWQDRKRRRWLMGAAAPREVLQ